MHYKKIKAIVNFLILGAVASPIFLLFTFNFDLVLLFIPIALFGGVILVIPNLLNRVIGLAISRFGRHDDNDILEHFADAFFARVLKSRISAQLDVKNEKQMISFAEALRSMFEKDALSEMRILYPEVSEQQWDAYFGSIIKAGKDAMRLDFFVDNSVNQGSSQVARKLIELYPFMPEGTTNNLVLWWRLFKSKMEWSEWVDSKVTGQGFSTPPSSQPSSGDALEKFIKKVKAENLDKSSDYYLDRGIERAEKFEFDDAILEFVRAVRTSSPKDSIYQPAKKQLLDMGFSEVDMEKI